MCAVLCRAVPFLRRVGSLLCYCGCSCCCFWSYLLFLLLILHSYGDIHINKMAMTTTMNLRGKEEATWMSSKLHGKGQQWKERKRHEYYCFVPFRVVSCVCSSIVVRYACVCVSHYCNEREGYIYYLYHFASFFLRRTYQPTHEQTDIHQQKKGGEEYVQTELSSCYGIILKKFRLRWKKVNVG